MHSRGEGKLIRSRRLKAQVCQVSNSRRLLVSNRSPVVFVCYTPKGGYHDVVSRAGLHVALTFDRSDLRAWRLAAVHHSIGTRPR